MHHAQSIKARGVRLRAMDKRAEHLDRLARQLKVGKNPACCRAINRVLAEMKKRCKDGEYCTQTDAEGAFRKFVESDPTCQEAKSASRHS
jgi:hypothetical protein